MPAIAAGTWQYNTDTVLSEVQEAINLGWNHVDTAHDYCGDGGMTAFHSCRGVSN